MKLIAISFAVALAPLLLANKDFDRLIKRPVSLAFDSSRDVQSAAACLALVDLSGQSSIITGKDRTLVLFGKKDRVFTVFVVTTRDEASRIEMHRRTSLGSKEEDVVTCAMTHSD